jgi:hypothetical protein
MKVQCKNIEITLVGGSVLKAESGELEFPGTEEKKEVLPEPKFAQKIEATFKDEEPRKKRHYKKRKKHAGGRPKKNPDEGAGSQKCPGCKKKIKKPNRWTQRIDGKLWHRACSKEAPEKTAKADNPMTIDERFEKYQETYGCKPTCGSCGDEIPKASLAVYMQKEFFHQVCMQREKEA